MSLVNILLLISLFLPLIATITVLLVKDTRIEAAKTAKRIALVSSLLNLLFALYFYTNAHSTGHQFVISYGLFKQAFINFAIMIDGISLLFLLVSNFLFVVVFTFINLEKFSKNAFALLLLLHFAVIGTFISSNLWMFYIFFELAVFLIFFLMQNSKTLAYAQYKFLLFNALGSLLMFICLVYMVYASKQASFASLFSVSYSPLEQKFLWWGLFLAFAIKSGIFPFHLWVKDTYSNSDNIINMILSGVLIKFGIYGLLRIVLPAFPIANAMFSDIASILALITAFYAMFMAFTVDNIKGFLAYFSLSHVGIIIFGIFALDAQGISGAIFQSISHSVFMIGFILVFILIERRVEVTNFSNISGLVKKMPILSFFLMILVLAGMSMPGTNAFIGEFLILQGAFARSIILAVVGTLTIVFSAAVVLSMYKKLIYGTASNNIKAIQDIKVIEILMLLIIASIIIATGLYPQGMLNLLNPYVNEVIGFIKSQEVIHGFF